MQTVRTLYLWPGRSYIRKTIEVLLAPIADTVWGKRRTLELYVNVVEWGDGIYGIEAAAQHYFGCAAAELTPFQAASLVAILPNPRKISPKNLPPVARLRLARVLQEYRSAVLPSA
jgi:monofunctional biosynthetic peptidoglycan transglycosylase